MLFFADFHSDAFRSVGSNVHWNEHLSESAAAPQQDHVYAANAEDIEFDLDSGFGDFSSSLDPEPHYASADVIVIDGGGFLQSGDESDNSDEFGDFINHEEAQRMLLCPTSHQTATFSSSAEKVSILLSERHSLTLFTGIALELGFSCNGLFILFCCQRSLHLGYGCWTANFGHCRC